jgi:4-hydroxy-4-methyl-2-oxoglutarate aldolase
METYPDWLNATLAADATEGRGVLPAWVQALRPEARVVGLAFVVIASQDDNQALVQAVGTPPPPGCVLVVGGQSTSRTATIGDLMALEIANLGVVGLVTDGLVRDAEEIRRLPLPVWCRGTTPVASGKRGPGAVGGIVPIGGALIRDGDLVIADGDGVVIWPREAMADLLTRAQAKLDADNARLARLRDHPGGGR